jgi:hypothetical protein
MGGKTNKRVVILAAVIATVAVSLFPLLQISLTRSVPDTSEIISLIIMYSTVGILGFAAFSFANSPSLAFQIQEDSALHRSEYIEVVHPKGRLKVRVLYTVLKNSQQLLVGSAEKCEVYVQKVGDQMERKLPFRVDHRKIIETTREVDPQSGQSIANVLADTLFRERITNLTRGQEAQVILGFFVGDRQFYLATEDAMRVEFTKGDTMFGLPPLDLLARAFNLSSTANIRLTIAGNSWTDAEIGYFESTQPAKGGGYVTLIRFLRPVPTSDKFQRMVAEMAKEHVLVARIIVSLAPIREHEGMVVYKGLAVKAKRVQGFSASFMSVSFPMTVFKRAKGMRRILRLSRGRDVLVRGVYDYSFHIDVLESVEELECSDLIDFYKVANQLPSAKDSDLGSFSEKHGFPVPFLRTAGQLIAKFQNLDERNKFAKPFVDNLDASIKKQTGHGIDRRFLQIDADPIAIATQELYASGNWQQVFRRWQKLGEQRHDRDVRLVQSFERRMFAAYIATGLAIPGLSFVLGRSTLFLIASVSLFLADLILFLMFARKLPHVVTEEAPK